MIIDCISDLHGNYPKLEGGDLLIIAGDLTARDTNEEWIDFHDWFGDQKYKKRVVISGNHDNSIQKRFNPGFWNYGNYLEDSGTEFEGLNIWGSPWTKTFEGMNPRCKAFTVDTEEELSEKWANIPDDVDILVTHTPAWSYLDKNCEGKSCGSPSLRKWMRNYYHRGNNIKLHICGHIHESYGKDGDAIIEMRINASIVNEHYQPVNKPIRIIL